jgi:hypothetical protein
MRKRMERKEDMVRSEALPFFKKRKKLPKVSKERSRVPYHFDLCIFGIGIVVVIAIVVVAVTIISFVAQNSN